MYQLLFTRIICVFKSTYIYMYQFLFTRIICVFKSTYIYMYQLLFTRIICVFKSKNKYNDLIFNCLVTLGQPINNKHIYQQFLKLQKTFNHYIPLHSAFLPPVT